MRTGGDACWEGVADGSMKKWWAKRDETMNTYVIAIAL
jgi:hypothetical protein